MIFVTVADRRFIVDFEDGQPVRIKERKLFMPGHPYLESIYDAPYWSAKHHPVGGPKTMVARILLAAKDQQHLKENAE